MGELEDLKRERARLQNRADVRADFKKRDAEKKELKREIREMKHPGLFAFGRGVKNTARGIGKSIQESQRKRASSKPQKKSRSKVKLGQGMSSWL